MYNYGAPRVGNAEFARYFESLFAGREAFRIVNGLDIVPRLPRGAGAAGAVLEYEHVGRTVLVAEEAASADGFKGFWVEGESDEELCPLRDASPLSNPFTSGSVLGDLGEQTNRLGAELVDTWSKIDAAGKVRSRDDLRAAATGGMSSFEKTKESIADRVKSMSAGDALSMIGLDPKFVESEMKMVESLVQGKAVEHHLEPSYFAAITAALDANSGGGGEATPATPRSAAPEMPPAAATDAGDVGADDPFGQIARLKVLLDSGAITQAEFEDKKRSLLDRI